jgi:hypothetical protein
VGRADRLWFRPLVLAAVSALDRTVFSVWELLMFSSRLSLGALKLAIGLASGSLAAPWESLLPFKRVDADARESYTLQEQHGPWLILAASFAGPGADQQAKDLVLELRNRYQLKSYLFAETFDFSEPIEGRTIDKFGDWKKMRYANSARYEAIAVLVGDFPSVDDAELAKVLERIKYLKPETLDLQKRQDSTQRFAGLRHFYRRLNGDQSKRAKGPMGSAFVTRNPLLPEEYFEASGVDDFVYSLNKGVEHSLLENPSRFTVRVATFRGDDTIDAREIEQLERSGNVSRKLEIAADQAHRLTVALRRRGVEAYEFHDRHESIVTVGSFNESTYLENGAVESNPAVLQVMQRYDAQRYQGAQRQVKGPPVLGLSPHTLEGIPFDVQPTPMKVPRRAVAAAFAPGRTLFR